MSGTTRFKSWIIAPVVNGKVMCVHDVSGGNVIYVDVCMTAAENLAAITKTVMSINEGDCRPVVEHVLAGLAK